MGRKNKSYAKDLHQQAYDRLTGMQAFGESKKEAMANGTEKGKIFSFNTYQTYWKHSKYFIRDIREKHPDCTTLKSAKKYAYEWLQSRVDQGLSADKYLSFFEEKRNKKPFKIYFFKFWIKPFLKGLRVWAAPKILS